MSKARKRFREPLNRDDYWMGMAFMLAAGSPSSRQQGCIIVGLNNEPVGMAHDGSPKTMQQECEHVVHAETNALFNAKLPLAGGTAYVTHTPCYHCVLSLAAANIKRIVYFQTKPLDPDTLDAMRCAYGQIDEFRGNLNWMRDYIKTLSIF